MKISVIVPVYKTEPYLRQCVDSILAQTCQEFELILVDDGSPDRAGAICDEYAERDSRVRVIHQQNGGLSAARNAGIDWAFAHSDSEWLTFIDSDDWIHPRYLEILLRANRENGTAISVCSYQQSSERTAAFPDADPRQHGPSTPEAYWCAKPVNATIACCKLYAKRCFSEIRYPLGKLHEDEFTTYRILFAEKQISVTPLPLYYYYQNDAGIMRTAWSPKRMVALDFLAEQIAYFENNNYPDALATTVRGHALWCKTTIEQIEAERDLPEAAHYVSVIRRRFQKLLLRYHRLLPRRAYENQPFYACAFPRLTALLHGGGRFLRKLKLKR